MLSGQFIRFGLIGVLGFVADTVAFYIFANWFENPYVCRLASYVVAATVTWSFNRHFTFGRTFGEYSFSELIKEWGQFLFAQGFGFLMNYGVFSGLVFGFTLFKEWPVLAIAAGSIAGLLVNFISAKFWVFRESQDDKTKVDKKAQD